MENAVEIVRISAYNKNWNFVYRTSKLSKDSDAKLTGLTYWTAASCNHMGSVEIQSIFCINTGGTLMEFLSIRQTAEKWGISPRRIQTLCVNGRIPGAMRVGYSWVLPADAVKPKDARIKSGKYVKVKE